MKLYHNPMSSCSQKVRVVLAEKGLAFDSAVLDLQRGDQFNADYLRLNPSALVPTLEREGRIYVESTLIIEYLDDLQPQPALTPTDPELRYRMRHLLRQIDDVQHPACSVLTYAIALRPLLLQKQPGELQALIDQIRDPVRREGRRSVLADGVHAPVFLTALRQYLDVLQLAEELLAEGPWICGGQFTLADCSLIPYVLRFDHLGQRALIDRRFPRVAQWYQAVQARPSWQTAISDWLPEAAIARFTAGGAEVRDIVAALADA
jgi:glutathione S-transferase